MTLETAIEIVHKFLDSKGYVEKRVCWTTNNRGSYIDVEMLKPYGLFIVNKDTGKVEDNYGVFEEEKNGS